MSTRKHSNTTFILPSQKDVYKIYKFIRDYEESYASLANQLNFDNDAFKQFLNNNDIFICPVSKSNFIKDYNFSNYISFLYGDKQGCQDKAHDLLRHLRNAAAHAGIVKTSVNSSRFDITDRTRPSKQNCFSPTITLRSNLNSNLFFLLIIELIKTKK